MRKLSFLLGIGMLLSLMPLHLVSQDPTVVQTLTFDDITKRRGKFLFPDPSNKWRKILVYQTLKCDERTTADRFACGEWDAVANFYVWDHSGLRDSTLQTHPNFQVLGQTPDVLSVRKTPVWDYYREEHQRRLITSTDALTTAEIGEGSSQLSHPFTSSELAGKAQYLWRASELSAAGLAAGDITGLRLSIANVGSEVQRLRIRLKGTSAESLEGASFETGLTTVYYSHTQFDAPGWVDLQFIQYFAWNGSDNILVEFSFESNDGGVDNVLLGNETAWTSGLTLSSSDYALNFGNGRSIADLGPHAQVNGSAPRTIEARAFARQFNGGGIFQAGPTGQRGADFSFRTRNQDNSWRAQLWGDPDFDVTLAGSKDAWQHYALRHDGTRTAVYYNGQLAGQEAGLISTPEAPVLVGKWNNSYFNGVVDEIRIWDVALEPDVIAAWKDREIDESHPNFANLRGYYRFSEGQGLYTGDESANMHPDGYLSGAWWYKLSPDELLPDVQESLSRPNIVFEQGQHQSEILTAPVIDSVMRRPLQVVIFGNPAPERQIPDNAPAHPTLPTDTLTFWEGDTWSYVYDAVTGNKIDSTQVGADSLIQRQDKRWYSPTVRYELGRFITPYGINLDLGPEGFTWVYDVTDYAHLLRDSVDLQAGDQRELIDLRFVMYPGTPPAEVTAITKIWERSGHRFSDLAADVALPDTAITIKDNAEQFRVKMTITGHGHNSDNGEYPHCCEWRDNTHYLDIDGNNVAAWKIWQTRDCAMNPVYPQGGTWPGAREGWCPGDVVKGATFNITEHIDGNSARFDYRIDPVPVNNLGMGNGRYVIAAHLYQYAQPAHSLDAEVYDVIAPNNFGYWARFNPMCSDPRIVIRNSGATTLTSVKITYRVSGGEAKTFTWNGSLKFLEQEEVSLPVDSHTFFEGDGENRFIVTVSEPNGGADEYADNDTFMTDFELPDMYNGAIIVAVRTNNLPQHNTWVVRDAAGNEVLRRNLLAANTLYSDTLRLPEGCYTFDIIDEGNDGLSYWAFPGQGNGYAGILNEKGEVLHAFESEFGYRILYSFAIGPVTSIQDPVANEQFSVRPNPARNKFQLDFRQMTGDFSIQVQNLLGETVYRDNISVRGFATKTVHVPGLAPGMYLLRCISGDTMLTRKLIIE